MRRSTSDYATCSPSSSSRITTVSLAPCPVPLQLRTIVGSHQGGPLRLETRRWRGAGFAALTMATIRDASDDLCSLTIIGLPATGTPTPILGVDLIGLGGALSLIAVDLAPTDDASWRAIAVSPLTALHAAVAACVVPRRWPSFAAEVFSPHALIAGVRRGSELEVLGAVADFVERAMDAWAPRAVLEVIEAERAAAADARVSAWCRAELRNRREHDALTRLFGEAPAASYLDMLFGAGATA